MKIPACCKNCSNRGQGKVCNCILPNYCQEWVEEDEVKSPTLNTWIAVPDYTFDKIPDLKIERSCDICGEPCVISSILEYPICDECKKALLKLKKKKEQESSDSKEMLQREH